MKKTNKIKQKTTGFDILYRVVTAIACVAIYPIFYFADMITVLIAHTDISDLLNKFTGDNTLHVTDESISLSELPSLISTFSGITDGSFDAKTAILENALYRPAIVAIAFIAIALVLGLVILGFAIFSNKIKVITSLSIAGFLSTIAAYISFTTFFARPLINGDVTISDLLNLDGIIASTIIGYLGDVVVLTLDGAFFGVMFIMLFILIWSASVILVNRSDEKEKAMKAAARKHN